MLSRVFVRTTQASVPRASARLSRAVGTSPTKLAVYHLPIDPIVVSSASYDPPGVAVTIHNPGVTPSVYQVAGNALQAFGNWIGLTSPPEVRVEAKQPDPEKPVDTSLCRAMLIKAVLVAAKDYFKADSDREEERRKLAAGEKVDGRAETESESKTKANKAMQDALKDYRDCLRKGMSRHEAIRKLMEDEGKSFIEGQVETVLRAGQKPAAIKAPVDAFNRNVLALESRYNSGLLALEKKQREEMVAILKDIQDFNAEIKAYWSTLKKIDTELGTIFTGITKDYTDVIRDTDGLARVNPKVVKAAEACRRMPDTGNISALVKALKDDKVAVVKAAGRDADKARIKAFETAMDKLIAKWVG